MILATIHDVISRYQGFIVDIWGVIHNGVALYPDVLPTFQKLKDSGKKIVLLSNAPRRCHIAKQRLEEFGLNPEFYDDIYTSGEDCHNALKAKSNPWYQALGSRFYHIGPERDRTIFEGLFDYQEAQHIQTADFLLVTGTYSNGDSLDLYRPLLEEAFGRNLPLLCANADRYVVYGEKSIICAGLIAETYEKMGGNVRYHGKPLPEIYGPVFDLLATPKEEILAIGDSLTTDILGATRVDLATLLIMNGVHRQHLLTERPEEALARLCQEKGVQPTYAMNVLC